MKEKAKIEKLLLLNAANRIKFNLYTIVDFCTSHKKEPQRIAVVEESEHELEKAKIDFVFAVHELAKKGIEIPNDLTHSVELVQPSNFNNTKEVYRYIKEIDAKFPF